MQFVRDCSKWFVNSQGRRQNFKLEEAETEGVDIYYREKNIRGRRDTQVFYFFTKLYMFFGHS
jgi:hypothetical protein